MVVQVAPHVTRLVSPATHPSHTRAIPHTSLLCLAERQATRRNDLPSNNSPLRFGYNVLQTHPWSFKWLLNITTSGTSRTSVAHKGNSSTSLLCFSGVHSSSNNF